MLTTCVAHACGAGTGLNPQERARPLPQGGSMPWLTGVRQQHHVTLEAVRRVAAVAPVLRAQLRRAPGRVPDAQK